MIGTALLVLLAGLSLPILNVAAKLRDLTHVEPRIGVYLFGLAIILSMLTTMRVDALARKSRPSLSES